MPHEMFQCEKRKLFKDVSTGQKYRKWVVTDCSALPSGRDPGNIRCMHCRGEIEILKQQDDQKDYAKHLRRADSEGCLGGTYFKGVHKLSDLPVED